MKLVQPTLIFLLFFVGNSFAQELQDPQLRDEDISSSILTVEYFIRPDGLYEYNYHLVNPLENKGEIASFEINLQCEESFDPVVFPPVRANAEGFLPTPQDARQHTPTAVRTDFGSAGFRGITANGSSFLSVNLPLGEERVGLRLLSPAEPGMRQYTLEPYMDLEGWDYPEDALEDEEFGFPWIEEFTVTGMIAAPGCPGVTEPPGDNIRFAGSRHKKESEAVNELLTYATPDRDKFHVETGTTNYTFHIYYSEDIDPDTFKVKPKSFQAYFNPTPGMNEKVTLQLKKKKKKKKTKIEFSVYSMQANVDVDRGKSDQKSKKEKPKKDKGQFKDKDKFEIRVSKRLK